MVFTTLPMVVYWNRFPSSYNNLDITDDNIAMLLEQKDKQIKDLQEQIAFLKVTIQDKVKSEERLQQIILSQNILQQPKLSVWQRMRSIFGNNQEHMNNV